MKRHFLETVNDDETIKKLRVCQNAVSEGVQLGPGAEGQGLRPGLEGQRGNSDLHAHGPWNLVIVRNRVGGLGIRMGMRL